MDENNPASNPEVEAALAGIKELEKEIALADYELRTFLNRHSFFLPSVNINTDP